MLYMTAARLKQAEYTRTRWSVVLEEGSKYDDVFKPEFWAHVAFNFRVGDIIEITDDENHFYAEVYVRFARRLEARVSEIRKVEFKEPVVADPADPIEVKWKGPHHKHAVVRIADGAVLQGGFATAEEAARWKADHLKVLAA